MDITIVVGCFQQIVFILNVFNRKKPIDSAHERKS